MTIHRTDTYGDWTRLYQDHLLTSRPQVTRPEVPDLLPSTVPRLSDDHWEEWQMARTVREDWQPPSPHLYHQITGQTSYTGEVPELAGRHLGQLKLFYSELDWLAAYSDLAPLIVYVGAAEGYHTGLLAELYPDHTWHLWDSQPFNIPERDNIVLHRRLFTDDDARSYQDQPCLFISDIRTLAFRDHLDSGEKIRAEDVIGEDLERQRRWVEIIRPRAASLKMRVPYYAGESQFFQGEVHLQPYSPASTEGRLWVTDPDQLRMWDHTEYDERMAYFNLHLRPGPHDSQWGEVLDRCRLLHNWDNALALSIIQRYLRSQGEEATPETICRFYHRVLRYHRQEYGRRFDVVRAPRREKKQR